MTDTGTNGTTAADDPWDDDEPTDVIVVPTPRAGPQGVDGQVAALLIGLLREQMVAERAEHSRQEELRKEAVERARRRNCIHVVRRTVAPNGELRELEVDIPAPCGPIVHAMAGLFGMGG